MKKPIFRVFISYKVKNKKKLSRKLCAGTLDTFVLTSNLEKIKNDKEIIDRICYINKKQPTEVDVEITKIDIENQYGETNDRFDDVY